MVPRPELCARRAAVSSTSECNVVGAAALTRATPCSDRTNCSCVQTVCGLGSSPMPHWRSSNANTRRLPTPRSHNTYTSLCCCMPCRCRLCLVASSFSASTPRTSLATHPASGCRVCQFGGPLHLPKPVCASRLPGLAPHRAPPGVQSPAGRRSCSAHSLAYQTGRGPLKTSFAHCDVAPCTLPSCPLLPFSPTLPSASSLPPFSPSPPPPPSLPPSLFLPPSLPSSLPLHPPSVPWRHYYPLLNLLRRAAVTYSELRCGGGGGEECGRQQALPGCLHHHHHHHHCCRANGEVVVVLVGLEVAFC